MVARIDISKKSVRQKCLFSKIGGKKLCSFSPHVGRPEEASIDQVAIKGLYPPPKIYIKRLIRKILALGMPPISLNTASNITHTAIASGNSSRVTTTSSAYCTIHCAARDFNIKFCKSRCEIGQIPYSIVVCA